ncbi:MAG: methionine--tRNA ligase [Alphaproteobacteria bacterium]
MSSNFYVTSPIYYVNDVPHIGHAYTSIACDVMARFERLKSHRVFFLTGTDEHGQKVEKSALAKGKTPQEFCDEVSQKFRDLTLSLDLSNDDFIRTTEIRHKKTVEKFWNILLQNGFIYKDVYEGWYAVRDEAFYSADEIIDGKAPTGAEVSWHREESYFFRLSAFEEKLLALYEAVPDFIRPQSRYNEIVSFVKSGLKDLSISRTSFSWGIKVPNDEKHVIYVWLDALTNYLSALDFADDSVNYQDFWVNATTSPLHIVGKDIVRFHAIYWPAFLMACNVNVPYSVFAHGWWTNDGQKISKSLGNVIDPHSEIAWIESFGCQKETANDYFRYFLLREVPFGNDGDYSRVNLVTRINAELANNIGNLAQRSLAMIYKNCEGKIPAGLEHAISHLEPFSENYFQYFNDLAFDKAIQAVIDFANLVNKNFNDTAPWNLLKQGKISEMQKSLHETAESLRLIAILLLPFVPVSANKILDLLNIENSARNFANLTESIKAGHQINEPKAVFPRLESK